MALHVVMGSFMFGCPYGPRDCSVSHFMIQKGTPHVSSTDFEESYSGQLSTTLRHVNSKGTQGLRVPFWPSLPCPLCHTPQGR